MHPLQTGEVERRDRRRGHRHQIEVAHPRIEAARDRGPIQIDPAKIGTKHGMDVGNQGVEQTGAVASV